MAVGSYDQKKGPLGSRWSDESMIELTERAVKKVRQLAAKQESAKILRVGVKGGGCSGLSYFLDFVEQPRQGDERLELEDDVNVVVDPKSLQFIDGTVLDFDTNLLNGGFKFTNPHAKKSCSCGESFAI